MSALEWSAVQSLRAGRDQRVGELLAVLADQLDYPPSLFRPLLRDGEHARFGERSYLQGDRLPPPIHHSNGGRGDLRGGRIVTSHRFDGEQPHRLCALPR